jgi:hypothetical protein
MISLSNVSGSWTRSSDGGERAKAEAATAATSAARVFLGLKVLTSLRLRATLRRR